MLDGVEFGKEVVDLVRGYCEREIAPLKAENAELKARLKAVEDRPVLELPELPELPEYPDFEALVADAVSKAIAALPKPQDGKDAANIVEALKHEGELVLTLQDGRLIKTGIRDGENGKPGNDGFGFDDMDACVLDDDRTIEFSFRRGDEEKAFTFKWPTVLDRGPFRHERELPYEPGDGVTYAGQFYICNEQTKEKPELSKNGNPWRLAVRKGRDGKDARG